MERTLVFELREFYEIDTKNKKSKKEDYDSLVLFFDAYYGGKAIDRKDYKILHSNILDILRESSEFIANIIDGVKSYPNSKSKLSKRLEPFLVHLKKKYKFDYSKNIFENFKIDNKNERLLMMLKYLHSGEKSRNDIAEDFGISERTVAQDLSILHDSITFLGTEMKIQGLERGTNKYRSLIHPVFLALNSAEIYSLTVGLKLLSERTVFERSLGRIANLVYEQLSESSKDMINKHKDYTVHFSSDPMKFIDTRVLFQTNDDPFAYYLKEPIECIVGYYKDGKYMESQGILKLAKPSHGNIYNKIKLENDEETIVLDIDNIMSIDRADKEEYLNK